MTTTYRAVQATGNHSLVLTQLPLRDPGPGQVRLRVEACGICGTDAGTVEGVVPGIAYPRVPGHEVVGTIDAIGAGVIGWKVGARVGVGFLGGQCHRCTSCRRGDFVNCQNQGFVGVHFDGGYAESMIAEATALAAIPDELSAVEAAPLLCAGVTTFNALRNSDARGGDLVAIHGVGGLGHLGVQFARRLGFRTVAIARGAEKAALAKELGAHHYIDASAEDAAAALQKLGGAKLIATTVTSAEAMASLVPGLGPKGHMVVLGASSAPLPLNTFQLLFGERSVGGSLTGHPIDSEDTLGFSVLQDIRARIETVPLAEAPAAYARMMRNEARFRIVLTMS